MLKIRLSYNLLCKSKTAKKMTCIFLIPKWYLLKKARLVLLKPLMLSVILKPMQAIKIHEEMFYYNYVLEQFFYCSSREVLRPDTEEEFRKGTKF